MEVITHEFFGVNRRIRMGLVPLGDIHIGSGLCDEDLLKKVVNFIKENGYYWVGMGDYCEFISLSDPRFDPKSLARWVRTEHLSDLVSVQRDRFLEIVEPIADRCLALLEGNHERSIRKHYERDVYLEIVGTIKKMAGAGQDRKLALGYEGWVRLKFYREKARRSAMEKVDIHLNHGFVGGRLAGAKALNMQRWLWTHAADLVLLGHSHVSMSQAEAVESLDKAGNPVIERRVGAFTGTFMRSTEKGTATYREVRGYLPLPHGGVLVMLRPFAGRDRKVQVTLGV